MSSNKAAVFLNLYLDIVQMHITHVPPMLGSFAAALLCAQQLHASKQKPCIRHMFPSKEGTSGTAAVTSPKAHKGR